MPRHIRNIVIAAILALLALAAGINGYIHHQFKTNIDNTLNAIQPFVQIKYSDLSTSILSGEVKLQNVRISADVLPETITLGNFTLETPGFAYMLNGPENLRKGDFPEHLGFAIDDFYFDLHGETAEWLDKLVKRLQTVYASERKICDGKAVFGPAELKEMGYTRILSNMRMSYNFNESKKTLTIKTSARTRNMLSMDSSIEIVNLGSMSSSKMLQAGLPRLGSINVTYKDETYTPRIIKYCSKIGNMTKEEFIEAEVKQSKEYFYMVWGFAPGDGLRDAYKDFLLKPELLTLSVTPSEEFNFMNIPRMSTDEIMDSMNIRLKINGLLVTDLSFTPAPDDFMENFNARLARSMDFNAILRGEPVKPPVVEKPKIKKKAPARYHKISKSQVSKYLNHYVRIKTKAGADRNGQLIRLDSTNLYVQKKVSGGKFLMTVPRAKIKAIEAYFSKVE